MAFDGNTSSFFDGPDASGDWCGIDLGAGVSKVITKISYYPRLYFGSRMIGGIFQGSNDETTWTNLYTIPSAPTDRQFTTTTTIGSSTAFRYLRYLGPSNGYCNVAEIQFYAGVVTAATPTFSPPASSVNVDQTATIADSTPGATVYYTIDDGAKQMTGSTHHTGAVTVNASETVKAIASASGNHNSAVGTAGYNTSTVLTGTYIGTAGSCDGLGNVGANAFDGNTSSFFDGPDASGDWCGIDLGAGVSAVITKISYYPRVNWDTRMLGGIFQGSNDETTWTNLYTIPSAPPDGQFTTTTTIGSSTAFRYLRYLSPTNGYCNVAEIQFNGHKPQVK
jgi:hypothetical protein